MEVSNFNIVFLNDGNWIFYVFSAASIGAIVNLYAFMVAGIWLIFILLLIVLVVLVIAFFLCLAGLADNN